MRQEQPNLASEVINGQLGSNSGNPSALLNQPSSYLSATAKTGNGAVDLDPLDEWAEKEAALEEADF
jgi:hypothetical protein